MLTKDTLFRRFVSVSNKALTAALLCLLSFASVSCKGDIDGPDPAAGPDAAREISFNPGTGDPDGTKTSYTNQGETTDGQLTRERIDWVDGDLFTVVSPQAKVYNKNTTPWSLVYSHTTPVQYSVCDYRVQSHSTATNPAVSRATIGPAAGADGGLQWGDGAHTFYAMYPSVNTTGYTATEKAKIGIDATQFKGTIPEAQTPQWGDGNGRGWPQMQYAYMFAATSGVQPESGAVDLNFLPQFTAFEFTVESGENDAVVLTSFEFEAVNGGAVTGDFVLQNADPDGVPVTSNTSGKITVNLNDTTVTKGSPFIFTVLALPVDMTNMRMKFTGPGIGTRTAVLKVKNNNNEYVAVNFTARNKYRITGIAFPKGITGNGEEIIWDQEAFGEDIIWENEYVFEGNFASPLSTPHTGGDVTLATGFRSCIIDNGEAYPEPFCFQYSPTGDDGSWTEGLPDWLSAPGADLGGAATATSLVLRVAAGQVSDPQQKTTYVRVLQPSTGNASISCLITREGLGTYVPGKFTVALGKQVYFASGNLVVTYRSSGNHEWEFEANQYDFTDVIINNINYETDGQRISHFGWGTGNKPYEVSSDEGDYPAFYDWGRHFDDAGVGLNSSTDGTWYTLSRAQWNYLLKSRPNADNLVAKGKIYVATENKYVSGLFILCDDWQLPSGCEFNPEQRLDYDGNVYTTGTVDTEFDGSWQAMEAAGAVFLPSVGFRSSGGNWFWEQNYSGPYWTSTEYDGQSGWAYQMIITKNAYEHSANSFSALRFGSAVRLVHD